ncbi:MAG: hypothetical protein JXD22_04230 [Sedimentisphaerales bacterium]|nr:hypothetical protein [Sedimentisphaerales bacterium]
MYKQLVELFKRRIVCLYDVTDTLLDGGDFPVRLHHCRLSYRNSLCQKGGTNKYSW